MAAARRPVGSLGGQQLALACQAALKGKRRRTKRIHLFAGAVDWLAKQMIEPVRIDDTYVCVSLAGGEVVGRAVIDNNNGGGEQRRRRRREEEIELRSQLSSVGRP